MNKWNEIRTAYKLAQHQTLSATAQEMGVHRSTVMRHIDALEEHLGVTLFQRNDKGYIPTEAGLEIMKIGQVTENQFSQLTAQLTSKYHALEGMLTITTLNEIASIVMPYIKRYQKRYPKMRVNYIGDIRNYSLEYGEADIAIRGGEKPTTPDNIVFPIADVEVRFCAHKDYIAQMGLPTKDDLHHHRFIAMQDRPSHLLWNEWIHNSIPSQNIVFLSSSLQVSVSAIEASCGIGAVSKEVIDSNPELVDIFPDLHWTLPVWALVHRDMYNLTKIKAFIDLLRTAKDEPDTFKM
ncbi:LysR family transcriptional regulator [uncultured Vibrio sp.]|uniref:LysR family transcriptional regulator n=1 Tax=uncultured Vibrio sp. TaxID=114054 RepID=UPI0025DF2F41|nr:LysR family transcriptional regulator [uncultured Vibrio sp.]